MLNQIILEYLKVILTWPVAIFIISLVFLIKFSDSIRKYIAKITELTLPGGTTVKTQPESSISVDKTMEEKGVRLSQEEIQIVAEKLNELDVRIEENKQKEEIINYLAYRSEFFEFSYLNYFYVPKTKQILKWLSLSTNATKKMYHILWDNINAVERDIIFSVLLNYGMVTYDPSNDSLNITDKGRRFIKFISS